MDILDILKKEVNPALGCTGPIVVSLATAAAKDAVGGTPKKIKVLIDKDTCIGSSAVVTPGTNFRGVYEPAALGALYGDSKLGLEVLKDMGPIDEEAIRAYTKENVTINIDWDFKGIGIYVEAFVETENGEGHAIIAKAHNNIVLMEANGKVLKKDESYKKEEYNFGEKDAIRNYGVKDFYDFAKNVDTEKLDFLKEAIKLNSKLAEAGLNEEMGAKFGVGFKNIEGNQVYLKAKMLAAAASDARMSGKNLSAMSCATSGNVGITASVPLIAVAEGYGRSEEDLIRALSLSYLLAIHVKSHIGRLSALCACSIAAGIGIAAATSFLIDKDNYEKIEMSIKSHVGSMAGVLCDGAKYGCALKLSSAVGVAVESAMLANMGICIPDRDGLVCETADETIAMIGKIASRGMLETDEYLSREIFERENRLDNR